MQHVKVLGRRGLLTLLFIASFAIPLIVGFRYVAKTEPTDELDPIFPNRIPLLLHSAYLSIDDAEALNPEENKDYLVSVWVKLNQLPMEKDDDTILFSKIDTIERLKPGYSLSLSRRGSFIRPVVYWKNKEGKGGWYEFSDMRIIPRVWMNFILSLKEGTLLGLHVIEQEEGKKPKSELLGSFHLSTPVYAASKASFILGADKGSSFRGSIGPIGVFSKQALLKKFDETLRFMGRDPLSLPTHFGDDGTRFFSIDGVNDLSKAHLKVTRSAPVERTLRIERMRHEEEQPAS